MFFERAGDHGGFDELEAGTYDGAEFHAFWVEVLRTAWTSLLTLSAKNLSLHSIGWRNLLQAGA